MNEVGLTKPTNLTAILATAVGAIAASQEHLIPVLCITGLAVIAGIAVYQIEKKLTKP